MSCNERQGFWFICSSPATITHKVVEFTIPKEGFWSINDISDPLLTEQVTILYGFCDPIPDKSNIVLICKESGRFSMPLIASLKLIVNSQLIITDWTAFCEPTASKT